MQQDGTNYAEFLKSLQQICLSHPSVNSFIKGKYRLNSSSDVDYGVIAYTSNTINGNIDGDSNYYTLSFNLLYADRLTHDRSNIDNIHAEGISVLLEILNKINNALEYTSLGNYTINLFNEQFADSVAGAFVQLTIQIPSHISWCDYFCYESIC